LLQFLFEVNLTAPALCEALLQITNAVGFVLTALREERETERQGEREGERGGEDLELDGLFLTERCLGCHLFGELIAN
jgi:hypothetical protein